MAYPCASGGDAGRWCPDGTGNGTHTTSSSKVVDLIKARRKAGATPYVSFEYFPPRTEDGVNNLMTRLGRMVKQDPLFIDFTWGAGGTTSELTVKLCTDSKRLYGVDVNMHMTCTNQRNELVDQGLQAAAKGGVRNICALRGDPPKGQEEWKPTDSAFTCALDLVKYIRSTYGDYFGISVSGYPEGHPNVIKPVADESKLTASEKGRLVTLEDGSKCVCSDADYAEELAYLKQKMDAGGEVIITQLFYDTEVFKTFVKDVRAMGIDAPILPGIMIIMNQGGFKRMTGFCKTRVPPEVKAKVESLDEEGVKAYGIELATKICKEVLDSGLVDGVHFYTLNLEKSTVAIMENLGLAKVSAADEATEDTMKGTLLMKD